MIQISALTLALAGFVLTSCSMLAGGAIAWGILRATVDQLKELVAELKRDVDSIKHSVSTLEQKIAVLHDRSERGTTGRHQAA